MSIYAVRADQVESPAMSSTAAVHGDLLSCLYNAAGEIARRRRDSFPGLLEAVDDDLIITFAAERRRNSALGWFRCDSWRIDDRPLDEIFVNALLDPEDGSPAESVLTTLIHELVHLWCRLSGIRDTSNRGRYHNKNFAVAALEAGLEVVRAPVAQHATPGLRPEAALLYRDLIDELNDALVLVAASPRRSPISAPGVRTEEQDQAPESAYPGEVELAVAPIPTSRYVAAECACEDGRGNRRALRMATGWWALGPVVCGVCHAPFEPRRPEGRTSG